MARANAPRATCHPSRAQVTRDGLCPSCYNARRRRDDPVYAQQMRAYQAAWVLEYRKTHPRKKYPKAPNGDIA
jgi:hypothetical protein